MQITKLSRAELEAFAREQYAQQFGRPAPPKVRNAQALVALGEHRPLRWRGHAYRVPPLPFRDGARLLVVSQVLAAEYEEAGGDVWAEVFELAAPSRALARARIMCGDLVQRRRFSRNPFRNATPAEVRDLIAFFLAVPDETPSLRAKGAQTVRIEGAQLEIAFEDGEELRTEISAKFTRDAVERELRAAGMRLEDFHTDDGGLFGLAVASLAG